MPLVWNTMCVLSFLHVDRAGKIRVVTAAIGDKNETDKNDVKWDDKQWITSHVRAFLATLRSWASHTPEPWITAPKDNDKTNRAGPSPYPYPADAALPLLLSALHCLMPLQAVTPTLPLPLHFVNSALTLPPHPISLILHSVASVSVVHWPCHSTLFALHYPPRFSLSFDRYPCRLPCQPDTARPTLPLPLHLPALCKHMRNEPHPERSPLIWLLSPE